MFSGSTAAGAGRLAQPDRPPMMKVQSDPTAGVASGECNGSGGPHTHAGVQLNRLSCGYDNSTESTHAAVPNGMAGKGSGMLAEEVAAKGSSGDLYSSFA